MRNAIANFDILYLLTEIEVRYSSLAEYEINLMLYLAKLLSLYDGNPTSKWSYDFVLTRSGSPFSKDVLKEIKELEEKNLIQRNENNLLAINIDKEFVHNLSKLNNFNAHTKYIKGAIDSLFTKTLPLLTNAIQNEPAIAYSRKMDRYESLYNDVDDENQELYSDFSALKALINNEKINIAVPASIWINYLLKNKGSKNVRSNSIA